jgi:YVTN family beta-propeller protein
MGSRAGRWFGAGSRRLATRCARGMVGGLVLVFALVGLVAPASAAPSFLAFESGPVRPLALSADGSRLYAVNTPDGQLEVFAVDASGLTPLRSIPVGQEPVAVAVRSASEVWVVNHLSDSVSVVDPTAGIVRRTLLVGDEPRDIVFAGPGGSRAFITTAHRGQHRTDASIVGVPGAGDPQLTTEGIGRADVWVFDAANLGATLGGTPIRIVTVFGDTPRALARSLDGTKVWVAIHHSGNRTTTINNAFVCNGFSQTTGCTIAATLQAPGGVPGPAQNFQGLQAPEVGLIAQQGSDGLWRDVLGRVWNTGTPLGSFVRFNLPDLDVFELDATSLVQTRAHAGVGTTLFNMAVNPASGRLYVSNTESRNLTQFEGPGITGGSTVQGHIAEARISVIDGASVTPRHLNKHIDYGTLAGEPGFDPTQRDHSLATPLEMAISSDGATLYVAAFGSSRIGVLPTAALEANSFDPELLSSGYVDVTGGGPAGLVLDEANDRLFVYTRFDNGISAVDLSTRQELAHWNFPSQEPPEVVAGRPFLYDARLSSGNGEASCSACHTFGDMDHLGWDLGNPDDVLTSNPMAIPFGGPPVTPPGLNGIGVLNVFHPMKGPMTTQTLRGMQHGGAMHWRGDRSNGFFGASPDDEDLAFRNFIVAFEGLLGREAPIAEADMQKFADFALSLVLPPSPVRRLDNQLTASASAGRAFFLGTPVDGTLTCENCHRIDASQGLFGGATFSTFEGSSQIFKVPHLRNMYAKVGMFGLLANFGGGLVNTGDQVRGFGFSHDGSVDTLFRFAAAPAFSFPSDIERRDSEAFMLQFDGDLAPIVGQQVTLDAGNAAVAGPRIDLLIARAATPFQSLLLDGATTECELVVKGTIDGKSRGWVRLSTGLFQADDDPGQAALVSDAALRAQVASIGPLTYTCVAPGSGTRVGVNRDLDVRLDALDNCPGHVNHDQADFDQDGLGDPCDPTPLPEPGLAGAVALGTALLAGLASKSSRFARRRKSSPIAALKKMKKLC